MQLEVLRLVTDRLRDPVLGVNAKLEAIPRDLPSDYDPPAVAFIGDETRDEVVAEFKEPPALPAIYVMEDGPVAVQGETPDGRHADTLEGAGVAVAIRYLDRNANTVELVQARNYVLRAIVRSVRSLLGEDGVTRNGIQMIAAERFDYGKWRESVGEAAVRAAVTVLFMVRDTDANA
jgi:hypothetical protein